MSESDPRPSPGSDGDPTAGRIVVGIDDSEVAAMALRWALAEGVLRQATVEVVHSWSPPLSALPFGATLVIPVDEAAIDSAARASARRPRWSTSARAPTCWWWGRTDAPA